MSETTPGDVTFDYDSDSDPGDAADLDESLGSDDVDAVLDSGYSPPELPLGMTKFGTTLAEEREGETLDQRLAQEEPDPALDPYGAEGEDDVRGEVGDLRAGRLVAPDEGAHGDTEKDLVGADVGIDGGAASAEEAAMHVIDEEEDLDLLVEGVSDGGE